jgi:hypothetical protein
MEERTFRPREKSLIMSQETGTGSFNRTLSKRSDV